MCNVALPHLRLSFNSFLLPFFHSLRRICVTSVVLPPFNISVAGGEEWALVAAPGQVTEP